MTGTANASYQVPNSNFEDWSREYANKEMPATWNASNVTQAGMDFPVIDKVTGRSGNAVKIRETWVGVDGIAEEISPSWITLGTPWTYLPSIFEVSKATAGTSGGIKFTARPDSMSVWVIREAPYTINIKGEFVGDSVNFNLVYYSWRGTSKATSYRGKNNACTTVSEPSMNTNEESDIRWETDRNACNSRTQVATQVGEGAYRSYTKKIGNWTKITVPITYYNNEVPEMMNIILSASNYPNFRSQTGLAMGASKEETNYLLVDDFALIYSSKVQELRLDGVAYQEFNQNTYTYTYIIPNEDATVADIPDIKLFRSGRELSKSEYAITYPSNLGEATTIKVSAEDGSSTTTYTIYFKAALSTNSRLSNIYVNGEAVQGFTGAKLDYNVTLPYGTTGTPTITVDKGNEKQTVEIVSCENFPCTATIKVTAENTDYSNTYKLNFSEGQLTDNTLQDILVDGKSIPGFKPTTSSYQVELPLGTTAEPTIEAVSKYADGEQNIVITRNGLEGTTTIVVTPPSGSARTYKITYKITESSYSYLQDILVGGVSLADFEASKLKYNYSLPIGTDKLPEISWVKGDEYQSVEITNEGVDGTSTIIVTAQNGNKSIYRITFSVEKSTVSTLKNIFVDGVALAGFSADVMKYEYNVAATATSRPVVTWEAADAYQKVTKSPTSEAVAPVVGDTKLTVRAQDGSTSVYTITFTQKLSSNSKLAGLSVAGYAIAPAFDPEVLKYTCALNRGTTVVPAISYVKGDETQVVRIDENGVNGTAKITVKAQSGATSTYEIAFSVPVSSDATLKDIKVGGVSIEGFEPSNVEYSLTLPAGTTSLPTIEAVKNDDAQRVVINRGGVNGTTSIQVIAESGATKTYKLKFSVEKSANATLKNIYVDGVALAYFNPEVLEYTYILPNDAVKCPKLTAEGYAGQVITITSPLVFGTASIEVTPEDGEKNVYTVLFTTAKSSNNQLSDIQLDGVTIDGFAPEVNEYNIVLPMGTTSLPAITYTKGIESQKVQVIVEGVNKATKLNVVAENGALNTYTINFSVEKSSDSSLSAILVGGELIDGFASNVFNYNVELPFGTTNIPVITYTKSNSAARVSANIPAGLGVATIEVVSEDGTSTSTYKVNFFVAKQSNANLNNIFVDGVAIVDFASDKFEYVIDWMAGTALPTFTYEKADATASVVVKNSNWAGCTFVVTAQDGTTQTYTVKYNPLNSSYALLSDIMFYNPDGKEYVSMPSFESDKFEYDIVLPWRTEMLNAVQPVPGSKGQRITIKEGSVNGTTIIEVLAQDGETTAEYKLNFSTEKSSESSLSNITVGDNDLGEFDSAVLDYEYTLPYGTTSAPVIGYEKAVKEQNVIVTDRGLNGKTTILVVAEDGENSSIYTITYKVADSGMENKPANIYLGGKEFTLQEGEFNYEIALGAEEELPTIEVVKAYNEQEVRILKSTKSYVITLISNQTGVDDVTYTIAFKTPNAEDTPTAPVEVKNYISNITVAGATMSPSVFNPEYTKYVAVISASDFSLDNALSVTLADGVAAEDVKVTKVTNRYTIETPSRTYNVYLHYASDVIPNGEFDDWSATTNYNGKAKPKGWTVPADADDYYEQSYIFVTRTYTTGSEVQKGDGYVTLSTRNSLSVLGSYFPGMATIGSMSVTLKNSGNSTSSISGGIEFRNTPDVFKYRYNFIENSDKSNNPNTHVYCELSDGTNNVRAEHKETEVIDEWKIVDIPFEYTQGFAPKTMNIVLNAAPTENAYKFNASWGAEKINEQVSLLHVEYVKFIYSNDITSIKVNGIEAELQDDGTTFKRLMDINYKGGRPNIEITTAVEDQAYEIEWTEETEYSYKANITSYAEDGSSMVYTLDFSRSIDTDNTLEELVVNNEDVLSESTEVVVNASSTYNQLPDVTAKAYSKLATVVIEENAEGNAVLVKVTAENGDEKVYTIKVEKEYSNDVTLKDITVYGYDIAYSVETSTYNVNLNDSEIPAVSYTKQLDGQVVEFAHGETTTIKVIAENGVDNQTYSIVFAPAKEATSALLSNLAVLNGEAIQFDANTFDYNTELNGDVFAQVAYAKAFASDNLTSVQTDDQSTFELTDGANLVNTYTINYTRSLSNNALLSDILVNGVSVADFDPLTTSYDVLIAKGEVVDLEPVPAEEYQTLEVVFDETTQTYIITVTAENAEDTKVYNVTLVQPVNNNANLKAIYIDGVLIDGFSSDVTEYNYTVVSEMPKWHTPAMPSITLEADAEGQTISMTQNGINGITDILVIAPDGTTRKEYSINFTEEKSSYVYLNSIAANYVELEDFNPEHNEYTVNVPVGEEKPEITFEKGDAFQKVDDTVEGKLVVTAENGDTFTYTINFVTSYTSNASLAGITLDGELIEGFASDKFDYEVELPVGTTLLPEIAVQCGAEGQDVQITTNGVNGVAEIVVTADDGVTKSTYTIAFSVKLSEVATLLDILLDGVSLEGFQAEKTEYIVNLPVGTRIFPVVSWVNGDEYQTATSTAEEIDEYNKVVKITTLAQDGVHSLTYTINLVVAKSSNNTLKDIQIDNVSLEGFDPLTNDYVVELPIGTEGYPEVTFTPGDEYQKPTEPVVNGNKVTINVEAEDGSKRTYTVKFVILHSSNTDLAAIYVDYELIEGFSPAVTEYNYVLPYGTTELPVVTFDLGDQWQKVDPTDNGVNGDYILTVNAEDGVSSKAYIIHFSVAKSDNALLSSILVNEELIPNFDAEVFEYTYYLPYGETAVPAVSYVKALEEQTVTIVEATSINEATTIKVVAEDGETTNVYTINWANEESTNANLVNIFVDGESLEEFDPADNEYIIVLPYGTTELPEVTVEPGDADQEVAIEVVDKQVVISVTAQDGTPNEYVVKFEIEKSTENRLKNIFVKGVKLDGFDPEVLNYDIVYPFGTPVSEVATIEDLTYELFDPIEQVELLNNGMLLMLQVTAENGDIRIYVIEQSIALSSNTKLDDILVNGKSLDGFDPEVLEYTYYLPYGAVTVPEDIRYVTTDSTQTVVMSINSIGVPTEIYVTAEDGTKAVYKIHFVPDDFNPNTDPTADNVCITSLPDGKWKFTTNCANVSLLISTLDGKVMLLAELELVDVNIPEICSPEANGLIFDAPEGEILVYYFLNAKRKSIYSGKFRTSVNQ